MLMNRGTGPLLEVGHTFSHIALKGVPIIGRLNFDVCYGPVELF